MHKVVLSRYHIIVNTLLPKTLPINISDMEKKSKKIMFISVYLCHTETFHQDFKASLIICFPLTTPYMRHPLMPLNVLLVIDLILNYEAL